jgi:hypothetical protein
VAPFTTQSGGVVRDPVATPSRGASPLPPPSPPRGGSQKILETSAARLFPRRPTARMEVRCLQSSALQGPSATQHANDTQPWRPPPTISPSRRAAPTIAPAFTGLCKCMQTNPEGSQRLAAQSRVTRPPDGQRFAHDEPGEFAAPCEGICHPYQGGDQRTSSHPGAALCSAPG